MAHLLGSCLCIESLHRDISDLQSCIIDIFSRVGPVKYRSWKYPDRFSCDLDMTSLLETYKYTEDSDTEDMQVAHFVLLELLIDRFLLFIQSLSSYMNDYLNPSNVSQASVTNTSIGVVSLKFWNKLLKLHSSVQQLKSEKTMPCKNVIASEMSLNDLKLVNTAETTSPSKKTENISQDCCHRSSQTYETAFVPCHSCSIVQKCFKETGSVITSMCQQRGLTSDLHRFRQHISNSNWLSVNEIREWSEEQYKDVKKILGSIEQLASQLEVYNTDLVSANQNRDQLKHEVKDLNNRLKSDKEDKSIMLKQHNFDLNALRKDYEEKLALETNIKNKFEVMKDQLQSQLINLTQELDKQTKTLNLVEENKRKLEKELEKMKDEVICINELKWNVEDMRSKLNEKSIQLDNTRNDLAREQAKYSSLSAHQQNVLGKQDDLHEQLEEMDQENEELKQRAVAAEDERDSALDQLGKLQETASCHQDVIQKLNVEKAAMEENSEKMKRLLEELKKKLEEFNDQELLLRAYPDLNGPIQSAPAGSGDVVDDMSKQIAANDVRIDLLQRQNNLLRTTVDKIMNSAPISNEKPVQLWDKSKEEDKPMRPPSKLGVSRNTDFIQERSGSRQTAFRCGTSKSQHRSLDRKVGVKSASSKTPNSQQVLERSDNRITETRHPSHIPQQENASANVGAEQRVMGGNGNFTGPEPLTCLRCDKMYTNAKDLEIHAVYCFRKPYVFGPSQM